MLAASQAHAGYYSGPVYSGTGSGTQPTFTHLPRVPYANTTATINSQSYSGWGGGACNSGGDGSPATCTGTIIAIFTWQPATGQTQASDPPPAQVVTAETSTAYAFGMYTPSKPVGGACDNGIGVSQSSLTQSYLTAGTPPHIYETQGTSLCSSTRYRVLVGGMSVKLTVSPSASVSGLTNNCSVIYSASIYPVTINLSGTTKINGSDNILVGQNCIPYLNIPGLPSGITVGWPTWSVSGDTFTSFYIGAGQDSGWAVPFPDPSANLLLNPPPKNPTFFWKDLNIYGNPETVQGSVILYNDPLGALYNPNLPPSAQICTVTASKKVQVHSPDVYSTPPASGGGSATNPLLGTVGIDTAHSDVVSNDPSGNSEGYNLQIAVVTPDTFTMNGTQFGIWAWLQQCQLNVTKGGSGTQMAAFELDSAFPYNTAGGAGNSIPGSTYAAQRIGNNPNYSDFVDSPDDGYSNYFIGYDTALTFNNSFDLYVMYQPPNNGPGVNWVPVDMYQWQFNASMTRSSLGANWTPNPPGAVINLGSTNYPEYPYWNSKFPP